MAASASASGARFVSGAPAGFRVKDSEDQIRRIVGIIIQIDCLGMVVLAIPGGTFPSDILLDSSVAPSLEAVDIDGRELEVEFVKLQSGEV